MENLEQQNEKGFRRVQRVAIDWLARPKSLRVPKTQMELADILGVSDETISNWKSDPEFQKAVWAKIQDLAGDDDSDIIAQIKINSELPGREGVADRRLWMQWRGQLIDKQEDVTKDRQLKIVIEYANNPEIDSTETASGATEDNQGS